MKGAINIPVLTLVGFACGELHGLRFLLYTKSNPGLLQGKELKANDLSSISSSPFVKFNPVKVLTHGYTSSYTNDFPQDMKNIYLKLADSYNIIVVDWESLAAIPYDRAAKNVRLVGNEIAKLITFLINGNFSRISDFHHIGHSLGGQVGAFISSNLVLGRKLSRVTGLDPGRPGFENSLPPANRLDPSDALFVDVITTSCGIGCTSKIPDPPRGTVDFYPNGGLKQPGCDVLDANAIARGLCSHKRSYKFYEESITTSKSKFVSYKCTSYENYVSECPRTQPAYMGEFVSVR